MKIETGSTPDAYWWIEFAEGEGTGPDKPFARSICFVVQKQWCLEYSLDHYDGVPIRCLWIGPFSVCSWGLGSWS